MKTRYYHYLALTGYFGLFVLLMLWNTVLAPSSRFPVAMVLLVLVTPLLLPLKGLLNANLKSCAWAAYISLIYFVQGTIEAYSNADERLLAGLEVVFSLLLFFGATFYVRFTGRAQKL
jgi:uncharacterized membrane protein